MPPEAALTAEGFAERFPVSRETGARLAAHLELLRRWQHRLNLVGPATLRDPWRRHVLDSAQLLPLLGSAPRRLLDVGSGAGFPGLVLAILGIPEVHLVESNHRKATFLREAARICACKGVHVHACRVGELPPFPCDAVTARAVAPLERLLHWSEPFCRPATRLVFPKGRHAERELTAARRHWTMRVEVHSSITSEESRILVLSEICRVRAESP